MVMMERSGLSWFSRKTTGDFTCQMILTALYAVHKKGTHSWVPFLFLHEFYSARCKSHHSQQKQAMFPTGDVGGTVGAFTIADREVHDLEVKLGCSKDQVKIPKRIEISKVGAVGSDLLIILAPHDL